MGNMGGYGHGGWMVLWWIGGIALLIVLVWFLAKRRGGSWEDRAQRGRRIRVHSHIEGRLL